MTRLRRLASVLVTFGALAALAAGAFADDPPHRPLSIRVLCVVSADDDPAAATFTAGFRREQLAPMIAELNEYFRPVGVRFLFDADGAVRPDGTMERPTDVLEVHDTEINRGGVAGTWKRMRLALEHADRLVLLFRDGDGAHVGPHCIVYWKGAYAPSLAHELGHLFGLPHTFANDPATITDAGERIRTYVEEGGHPRDRGLDVFDGDLDFVSDTPPCMQGAIWATVWQGQGGVERQKGAPETAGFPLDIPVTFSDGTKKTYRYRHLDEVRTNFMSYWGVAPYRFSADQVRVMRKTLHRGAHLHLHAGVGFADPFREQMEGPILVVRGDDVRAFASDARGVLHAGRIRRVPGAAVLQAEWASMGDHNGSNIICGPSAVWRSEGTLDLAAAGDGIVNKVGDTNWWPSATTWAPVGVWTSSGPTLASVAPTRLDVFARAMDGSVFFKSWTQAHQAWSSQWRTLGGSGVGAPSVAALPGGVIVAVRTADGTVAVKRLALDPLEPTQDVGTSSSTPWIDLGGAGSDEPAAAGSGSGVVVAAREADGQVALRRLDARARPESDWLRPGLRGESRPALVGGVVPWVCVRRSDGAVLLSAMPLPGGPSVGPIDLGGDADVAPAIARLSTGELLVVIRAKDGGVQARIVDPGRGGDGAPGFWIDLGFPR